MSFKINKSSKFKIDIQPKNSAGQTQLALAQPTGVVPSIGPDISSLIDTLIDENKLSSESVEALGNRHVSKAFEDLYKRGVNPLRAEVVFINELLPISTGEISEEDGNIASINLNYGEGKNLKVNQVMRLIDLQRIIRKNILKRSGDFLEEFIDISNQDQKLIIIHMHKVLKRDVKDFISLGSDTESMVLLLIENSAKRLSQGVAASSIDRMNKSNKSGYLKSIARYVLLDYVAQNSIAFITRIYDLKDLLKEAISIAQTELPPADDHSPSWIQELMVKQATPNQVGIAASNQQTVSSLLGLTSNETTNTASSLYSNMSPVPATSYIPQLLLSANDRISAANMLLRRWGMPNNEGPDGFSPGSKHSLASVIGADVSAEKTEALFGSNKHMYVNLFANLLKSMTFMQTLAGEGRKQVNKQKISFTAGNKNLAKGLKILKSITPSSMASSNFVIDSGNNSLDGAKIGAMLSAVSGDKDEALTELVAAVCYDQTAGSNTIGGLSQLLAPKSFNDFEGLGSLDNVVIDYFNKVFFNTGKDTWASLTSDQLSSFDYPEIAKNKNLLGAYLKSRFLPVTDKGVTYVPNEHTYEDNEYTDDLFINSPDYFFNKAVESEKFKFDEMVAQSKKIVSDIDTVVHDISMMLGLDFDASGEPDVSNINGFTHDQNPLAYFYSMCEVLGIEARRNSNDLEESCNLAVPLIQAGKLDNLNFTADVIKGSFFSSIGNKSNAHLLVNTETDADGSQLDPNITKPDSAREEALLMFSSEKYYYAEDRIWYRLFRGVLSSILADGSPDSVKSNKEKYGADKSIKYNAIISNGLANGIAKFNNSEDDEGDKTYIFKDIGAGNWVNSVHDDQIKIKTNQNSSDSVLGDNVNIDAGINGWELAVALAIGVIFAPLLVSSVVLIAASFGSTFLGLGVIGSTASVVGGVVGASAPLFVSSFLGALAITVFSTVGIASMATGAVISLGAWAAINELKMPDKDSRPVGVGFSKSGLFETFLLTNSALIPKSLQPKTQEDAEDPERIQKVMTNLFNSFGKENIMLKAKPGNGRFKEWNLVDIIDKIAEFFQSIGTALFGDLFGGGDDGVISEADLYKPYFFKWNDRAGEYGGIFSTNTASRYTIFSLFFSRIMYKSLVVRYGGGSKHMYVKYYPTCWIAMADALQRKPKNADYDESGKYSALKPVYDLAYNVTANTMNDVKNSMHSRRSSILRNLQYLKQNSDEIQEAVRRAESVLNGNSSSISKGEQVALNYLQKVGFVSKGLAFLNDNTAGTLLSNYQKKYLLDFKSDDELDDSEGVSVYPYFKLESYDIRELKLMAKVFSQKDRGLTSSIDDSLGRKTIVHVGIPNGMIRALQNEAYSKTGDIAYYYSSNIAIHITKKNDLDPQIKYQSRTYVFNMSKYIASIKSSETYSDIKKPGQYTLGNHIEKYDDNWSLEKIKENIEILTASRLAPYYEKGIKGITKIGKSKYELESEYDEEVYESMLENHIFDHYAKMYTASTTGIDISETNFPLDTELLFEGTVDEQSAEIYENVTDELIRRFPASNIIPSEAQEYYRVVKSIRSSLYFSSESRFESFLSTQCFQRVFSIPISERDFALKQAAYNMKANEIYKAENIPKLTLTNKKMISLNKIIPPTGIDENVSNSSASEMFNTSPAKIVLEYQKGLNPNKTDISSFIIEVAILKSSNLS